MNMIILAIYCFTLLALFFWLIIYLFNKQVKLTKTLKVGDEVYFGEYEGEIIEKINDNLFVIKTKVVGMKITKKNK